MKKVYFITRAFGPIYYMEMPDQWNEPRLDVGHNNSYEMRSTYTSSFSENFEDVKKIVEANKKFLMMKKYKEMIDIMQINTDFKPEDAVYHDGSDAP